MNKNTTLKKKINYFFLLLIFIVPFNLYAIENKIIVKIDNQIVTNIDILNEINYLIALNPNLKNLTEIKLFEIAKNSLIREKIKLIEISKLNEIRLNEEYLENILKNIYKRIGFENKNQFLSYIESFNVDIKTIEKKLETEAIWNQLIYLKFKSKLKIDKKKIKEEINLNKETINSYLLYEIVFNVDKNENSEELFKKIKESIDENGFENTASIFSISDSSKTGGKLGWISESSINKKILKQISKLNKDQYTDPIRIPQGFLILNLRDKKVKYKKIDIESELATKIRTVQNQQLNQYSIIYYNKIKKDVLINEK